MAKNSNKVKKNNNKKNIARPTTLQEFVGQEKIKYYLIIAIYS